MRRSFLFGGAAALSSLLLPRAASASTARRIALRHSGTGARFAGTWHDGQRPDRSAMADLSAVLADPGVDQPVAFDPDTIEIMWLVAQRTRLGDILDIHSGYRTPRVNRAVHGAGDSQHLRATAVDLGVPAGRMAAVADAALRLGRGGVGVYRSFVHLDTGPVRTWRDRAGRAATTQEDTLNRIAAEWQRGRVRVDRF